MGAFLPLLHVRLMGCIAEGSRSSGFDDGFSLSCFKVSVVVRVDLVDVCVSRGTVFLSQTFCLGCDLIGGVVEGGFNSCFVAVTDGVFDLCTSVDRRGALFLFQLSVWIADVLEFLWEEVPEVK